MFQVSPADHLLEQLLQDMDQHYGVIASDT